MTVRAAPAELPGLARDAGPAVRHLYPRAVLRHPLRLLRLQHLHARRAGRREPRRLAGRAARRARPGRRRGWRRAPRRSTRCSSAAARRRCWAAPGWPRCSTRSASTSRWPPDAEVTTEANPESTSPEFFDAAAGRRLHPGVAGHAVGGAARAGGAGPGAFAGPGARRGARSARARASSTSTSTSSTARRGRPTTICGARSTRRSSAGVDHVSAYALVVEDGTALARRVRRGEIAAARRRRAGAPLRVARRAAVGGRASTGTRCPTGAGPAASAGTTSATGTAASGGAPGRARTATSASTRWWNVKHPNAYAQALADGRLPVADFEQLDARATAHRGRDAAAAAAAAGCRWPR